MPINDQVLEELRGLRKDLALHGERLAGIEAKLYLITGNGQPGRLGKLEESVQNLREWRAWIVGIGAAMGAVGGAVWHLAELVIHH